MIIGFSGKAGAGKDTCIDMVKRWAGQCSVLKIAFADALKTDLLENFSVPYHQLYGCIEDKNLPTKYRWSDMPGVIIADKDSISNPICPITYPHIVVKYGDSYMTGRELMEYYGTNIMRKMRDGIWLERMEKRLKQAIYEVNFICVSDVRFPNEVELIEKMGGIVIRLTRGNKNNKHISNTALDTHYFKNTIDNEHSSLQETEATLNSLLESLLQCK